VEEKEIRQQGENTRINQVGLPFSYWHERSNRGNLVASFCFPRAPPLEIKLSRSDFPRGSRGECLISGNAAREIYRRDC